LDEATLAQRAGVRRADPLGGAAAWITREGIRAAWGVGALAKEMAAAGINVIIEDFKAVPRPPGPPPPPVSPPPQADYQPVIGGLQRAAQRFVAAGSAIVGVAADLQKVADHFLLIEICSAVEGKPGPALVSIPFPPEEVVAAGGPVALSLKPPLEVTPGQSYFLVLHTFAQAGEDGQVYRWRRVGDVYPDGEAWREEGNGWVAQPDGQDWGCEIEYAGLPPLRLQAPSAAAVAPPPPPAEPELPPWDQAQAIATADRCREAGVRLFIAVDLLGPGGGRSGRRAVDAAGRPADIPCPLSETLWLEDLLPRLQQIALWSRGHGLTGLLLNAKMAGHERLFYGEDLCFCDDCWRTFARPGKRIDLVRTPASKRRDTLQKLGLLEFYQRGLGQEVTRRVEQVVQRVTALHPGLLLGLVHGRFSQPGRDTADNWFYRAVVRGLARPGLPPLVLTYSLALHGHQDAYGAEVPAALARWQQEGLDIVYVSGLFLADHPLSQLPLILRKLRAETDGYWLFGLGSAEAAPGPSLPGSLADYQAVLQAVNGEPWPAINR